MFPSLAERTQTYMSDSELVLRPKCGWTGSENNLVVEAKVVNVPCAQEVIEFVE